MDTEPAPEQADRLMGKSEYRPDLLCAKHDRKWKYDMAQRARILRPGYHRQQRHSLHKPGRQHHSRNHRINHYDKKQWGRGIQRIHLLRSATGVQCKGPVHRPLPAPTEGKPICWPAGAAGPISPANRLLHLRFIGRHKLGRSALRHFLPDRSPSKRPDLQLRHKG